MFSSACQRPGSMRTGRLHQLGLRGQCRLRGQEQRVTSRLLESNEERLAACVAAALKNPPPVRTPGFPRGDRGKPSQGKLQDK